MLMYLLYMEINIAAHRLLQKGATDWIDFCKKSGLAEFKIGKIMVEKFLKFLKIIFFQPANPGLFGHIAHEM